MHLSIIIPILNEEQKIARDIREAINFFESRKWKGEVIVVNDGSNDASAIVVQDWVKNYPHVVSLLSYRPNRGKGYAVRQGILAARGEFILFADSGYCIPYRDMLSGIEMIKRKEADIAHGSRNLPQSKVIIARPWHRRLISYWFRKFIKLFAKLPGHLTDSQCGFKLYYREVAHQLYSQCQSPGFMFDVEVILLADKSGFTIREFPVHWTPDSDTRINLRRNLGQMVRELFKIKRRFTSINQ